MEGFFMGNILRKKSVYMNDEISGVVNIGF